VSIDVQVSLGYHNEVMLKRAILIYENTQPTYGGPNDTFASVHAVRYDGATPLLEAGMLVSVEALRKLSKALGPVSGLELLPPHVLAANTENLVWFEPARERAMFFQCSDPLLMQLSGSSFPQPALLFIAGHRSLRVLALDNDNRPNEASRLYTAPYWNTNPSGVCLGSTSLPDSLSAKDTQGYSGGFFASAFTHGSCNLLYRNWLGTMGELWQKVKSDGTFSTEHLVPLEQTLGGLFHA
jgi:PRTRC genetic system protein B